MKHPYTKTNHMIPQSMDTWQLFTDYCYIDQIFILNRGCYKLINLFNIEKKCIMANNMCGRTQITDKTEPSIVEGVFK